ncbi:MULTISPECIES: DeoR/GlpR family DNA-binding transcription regulator [unclassified Pantoea]|uniref:DeoR/GlpR family DNA-binding transcription regulator n=1 Tax=unclassified Pantoea TaxID=2630326 RepID=UPI001CD33204|nr:MULTISPECIES: DeoR/GlpR family DNA-binding transcription regulator [unclassified Pantoea]MCA1179497.1 DeoR/GlpR family DNA-binding transcription regulator [Pantoea sp. alder69]MCA1251750.1 DeoR/GlpR family DNA-binding transcription regulator [Pantoea sp. alder70]MCA1267913.1 DeoR/GlpR family DNA-binding transcription regulator [Pantoea sp. alder81]
MNAFDRRNRIVDMVNSSGSRLVTDISAELGVTEVTVRADIRLLEERGLVTRFHGGAASIEASANDVNVINTEVSLSERYEIAADPKQRIAIAAARLVKEGDTVILDSGSTTKLLAEALAERKNIAVITNSLPAATILSDNKDITLVVCGGTVRHKTASLHGSIAELALRDVSANLMFVGADGLDVENGITTFNEGFAISAVMAAASKQVVVLTDSSKFGRKGFNQVLSLDKIHTVITDEDAPAEALAELRNKGKTVIVA